MLGLKEGLLLHGTQMLYSFSHGRELLLEGERGHGDWKLLHIAQLMASDGCAARESSHPVLHAARSEACHKVVGSSLSTVASRAVS